MTETLERRAVGSVARDQQGGAGAPRRLDADVEGLLRRQSSGKPERRPGDPIASADAIRRCLADPSLRDGAAPSALRFAADTVLDQVESVLAHAARTLPA